jgi:hypothetical protein
MATEFVFVLFVQLRRGDDEEERGLTRRKESTPKSDLVLEILVVVSHLS